MRYTPEYKEQARQKLVEAGGRHAKRHGFAGSGMSDLAAAAGVTTGSLYKHFSGKSDLFVALITAELQRTADLFGAIDPQDASVALATLASYLSLAHVKQPEGGCPLPSLTVEVARADGDVKQAFQTGVAAIHANLEKLTGNADRAWALMAQNVGAVMIARALSDEGLQRELLAALRKAGAGLLLSSNPREEAPPVQ